MHSFTIRVINNNINNNTPCIHTVGVCISLTLLVKVSLCKFNLSLHKRLAPVNSSTIQQSRLWTTKNDHNFASLLNWLVDQLSIQVSLYPGVTISIRSHSIVRSDFDTRYLRDSVRFWEVNLSGGVLSWGEWKVDMARD